MKIYRDVEQGTIEWHEIKHGKIGGTRSKQLLTKSDTLLIEMIAETVEPFDEDSINDFMNDAMARGVEMEPGARKALIQYTGLDFQEVGWIQSDIPILGISPDGLTLDERTACEIKCLGAKKHIEICMNNEIPSDFIDQCIHYFTVIDGLERLFFLSYRPEFTIKPMFIKVLELDTEVNIGTKARPVLKTVAEVVEMKKQAAIELQEQINNSINNLKF